METSYPTKIDWWIGVPLFGVPVLLLLGGLVFCFINLTAAIVFLLTGAVMGLAIFALSCPIRYTLKERHLEIRTGLGEELVNYGDIQHMEPLTSLWSASALSVQRVNIATISGTHHISPKNRERFIQDLTERISRAKAKVS